MVSGFAPGGRQTIPTLVADGEVVDGEQPVLAYLQARFIEPPEAQRQRAQAAKAKHKQLEEACRKLAAATP